jgi:hypothetical protein
MAIVRDHEGSLSSRLTPLDEPVLEELDAGDVEVIGGLVEKEHGGAREEEPRDLGAVLLPSREFADGTLPEGFGKPDTRQDAFDPGLGFVATLALEKLAGVVEFCQKGLQFRFLGGTCPQGDGILQPLDFGFEDRQVVLSPRHERFEWFGALGFDRLLERREGDGAGDEDLPSVGIDETLDDLQDRGLPGPVAADKTDDTPRVVLPGHVSEHVLGTKRFPDTLQAVQHGGRIA